LDSSFFVNHVFHVLVFCQKEQKVRYIHDGLIIPDFNWRRCIQSVRRCGDADSLWRFSSLTSNRAIHVCPVFGRLVPRIGSCPSHPTNTSIPSLSTRDNSTAMAPIHETIADFKLRKPRDDSTFKKIAEKHDADRSTLEHRCKGMTGPWQNGYATQQKLSSQQEEGLVCYIRELTAYGLPPTRAMIQNFASNIL
jgi:hypothetical protein